MIIELQSTIKAVRVDIKLNDKTAHENIRSAIIEGIGELMIVGLFPYSLVVPESKHHLVAYSMIPPTITNVPLTETMVGHVQFPSFNMTSPCMIRVSIRSDRRLKDSVYILATPFDPFVMHGIQWPEEEKDE